MCQMAIFLGRLRLVALHPDVNFFLPIGHPSGYNISLEIKAGPFRSEDSDDPTEGIRAKTYANR
jgi:hypothetical protein